MADDAPFDAPLVDRTARLVICGALCVFLGLGSVALAALTLAMPLLAPGLGVATAPDWRAAAAGTFTHLALAGVFIALGVGSIRRRRWVPPLIQTLAWCWLLAGLFMLALLATTIDVLLELAAGGGPLDPAVAGLMRWLLLGIVAIGGCVVPTFLALIYRDPHLARTCAAHDPRPSWTERCPSGILGLAVVLAATAVTSLPLALKPAVPLFGVIVTGWPGALVVLLFAAACAWLARELYRLKPRGYWGTLALLVVAGVSTAATFLRVEPIELFRAMGYPEESLTMLSGLGRTPVVVATLALTVVSVAYMVGVRKSFFEKGQ